MKKVELGEMLSLEYQNISNVSYSGKNLARFLAVGCRFESCQFENMKIDNAVFGGGEVQTIYSDCSFDNTKIKRFAGMNRFIRCSFRNMDIGELFGNEMEFIDCCFAGTKLRKVVFFATTSQSRKYLNKAYMDFYGNDFSEAKFDDVDFRTGIDFTKQKLPVTDNLIYVYDFSVLEKVKSALLSMPATNYTEDLLIKVKISHDFLKDGQKHFFLNIDHYTRDENEKQEIRELFKRCAEA